MKVETRPMRRRNAFRFHCLIVAVACLCLLPSAAQQQQQQQQQQSVSLSGQVRPAGAAPMAVGQLSTKLYFPKTAGRSPLLTSTDAGGYFKFEGLPTGTYLLEVYSGNSLLYQTEVKLDKSSKLDIPVGRTDSDKVVIQYFPKAFDQARIENVLQQFGGKFKISRGKTEIGDTPTNAIFYGSKVRVDDVKAVARALIDAGIELRVIKKSRSTTAAKANTIQIGADRGVLKSAVWDQKRLSAAPPFDQ
jgi:hypothetical protein